MNQFNSNLEGRVVKCDDGKSYKCIDGPGCHPTLPGERISALSYQEEGGVTGTLKTLIMSCNIVEVEGMKSGSQEGSNIEPAKSGNYEYEIGGGAPYTSHKNQDGSYCCEDVPLEAALKEQHTFILFDGTFGESSMTAGVFDDFKAGREWAMNGISEDGDWEYYLYLPPRSKVVNS